MSVPRLYRQGVDMGRGAFSTVARWIFSPFPAGVVACFVMLGCQSSTSIKGAKSEASASSGSTRFSIKTAEPVQPAPVKVRVKVKESK